MPDGNEQNGGFGGQGGQQPEPYAITGGKDDYAFTTGDSIWGELSDDDKWLLGELGITDDRHVSKNQYESDSSTVMMVQKLLNIYNKSQNEGMGLIAETGNYNEETRKALTTFRQRFNYAGKGHIEADTVLQILCAIELRNGTCEINRIDGIYLFNTNLDLFQPDLTSKDVEDTMNDAVSYASTFFFIRNLTDALTDFLVEIDKIIDTAATKEAAGLVMDSKMAKNSKELAAGKTVYVDIKQVREELSVIKQAIKDCNPGAKYQLDRRINDMRNLFHRMQEGTAVAQHIKFANRFPQLAKAMDEQLFHFAGLLKGARQLGKVPWLRWIGAIIEGILAGIEIVMGVYNGDLYERRLNIIKHTLNAIYQILEAVIVNIASTALVAAGHPLAAVLLGIGWMIIDLFFFSDDDTFGLPTRNLINDAVDYIDQNAPRIPNDTEYEFNGIIDINGI